MYISDTNRFIFFGIPYNTPKSLHDFLLTTCDTSYQEKVHGLQRMAFMTTHNEKGQRADMLQVRPLARDMLDRPLLPHLDPITIRSVICLPKWSTYFKFAIVMNPWARAVQSYKRLFPNTELTTDNIKQFYMTGTFRKEPFRHLLIPQVNFVTDADGTIIVDYIGKFEDLVATYAVINNKLGNNILVASDDEVGQGEVYKEFYDDELKEIIDYVYKKDIEFFGYTY